jgi:hypothetical protein
VGFAAEVELHRHWLKVAVIATVTVVASERTSIVALAFTGREIIVAQE